jgi:hypothetical protein
MSADDDFDRPADHKAYQRLVGDITDGFRFDTERDRILNALAAIENYLKAVDTGEFADLIAEIEDAFSGPTRGEPT